MQGDLFASAGLATSPAAELMLDADQLQAWQQRLHGHQAPLFRGDPERTSQTTLFGDSRAMRCAPSIPWPSRRCR